MNRKEFLRSLKVRKLKRIMRDHHLKCRDVAELVGVKEQTVRTWRSGRHEIRESFFKLLPLPRQ